MNDYWNDPPETPEPPSCPNGKCEGSGEYLYDGKTGMVFSCAVCAYQWVIPFPADPEPEPEIEPIDIEPEPMLVCPHGKTATCNDCDHLSDLAYDAARERRYR
jgi:hypothetical protein